MAKFNVNLYRKSIDLLSANVEVDVPDDATHEQIVAAAIEKAENSDPNWEYCCDLDLGDIEPDRTGPEDVHKDE